MMRKEMRESENERKNVNEEKNKRKKKNLNLGNVFEEDGKNLNLFSLRTHLVFGHL